MEKKFLYVALRVAYMVNLLIGLIAIIAFNVPVAITMFIAAYITKKVSSVFSDEESNS